MEFLQYSSALGSVACTGVAWCFECETPTLAVVGDDGTLEIWSRASEDWIRLYQIQAHSFPVSDVCWSSRYFKSSYWFATCGGRKIVVWGLDWGSCDTTALLATRDQPTEPSMGRLHQIVEIEAEDEICRICWNSFGTLLAASDLYTGLAHLWHIDSRGIPTKVTSSLQSSELPSTHTLNYS